MSAMKSHHTRAMLYVISTITSVGAFGAVAEFCGNVSFGRCSNRSYSIVGLGVISTLLAIACTVLSLLESSLAIELSTLILLFIINSSVTGLISSSESEVTIVWIILPWITEISVIVAFFYLFFANDTDDTEQLPTTTPILSKETTAEGVAQLAPTNMPVVITAAPTQLPYVSTAPTQLPFVSTAPTQLPFVSTAPVHHQVPIAEPAPPQLVPVVTTAPPTDGTAPTSVYIPQQ